MLHAHDSKENSEKNPIRIVKKLRNDCINWANLRNGDCIIEEK